MWLRKLGQENHFIIVISGGSRLGGGGGGNLDLLAMAAIFLSVISSFFTQNKGGGRAPRAPPLDPPLVMSSFSKSSVFKMFSVDTPVWRACSISPVFVTDQCGKNQAAFSDIKAWFDQPGSQGFSVRDWEGG